MVSFTSLSVLLLSTLATIKASPISNIVPTSECTTIASGQLKTTAGQTFQFTGSELTLGGSLQVEFQSCQPNFGHFDGQDGRAIGGHLYVPSAKKCLSAYPTTTGPPFKFELANCYVGDDSGQVYSQFIKQSDGQIFYAGTTQADGSSPVWGCVTGVFGVFSNETTGVAKFHCGVMPGIVGLTL